MRAYPHPLYKHPLASSASPGSHEETQRLAAGPEALWVPKDSKGRSDTSHTDHRGVLLSSGYSPTFPEARGGPGRPGALSSLWKGESVVAAPCVGHMGLDGWWHSGGKAQPRGAACHLSPGPPTILWHVCLQSFASS